MPAESTEVISSTFTSGSFEVVDGDLTEAQRDRYRASDVLAIDTETMGLIPHRDRLCLVQLCDREGHGVMIRIPQGHRQSPHLQALLEDPGLEKIFHFARFDLAMLKYHLGIRVAPLFCTKIASKLARTYTPRHGLKDLIQELCGVELDKKSQTSDWGSVQSLSAQQLAYAANDVRYLVPARDRLQAMLERESRWDLATRCFAHLPTLIELDLLGYDKVFEHG